MNSTLSRWSGSNQLIDNFSYQYHTGTNKLRRVTGTETQFSYDNNGNVTQDLLKANGSGKYDHRNLLIEINNSESANFTFWTRYYYDEAGNRIRKLIYRSELEDPEPINWDNPGDSWTLYKNEFYVRDLSGKEIAVYNGTNISEWNIYGLDNIGKVHSDRSRYYYLKDHLGSIRATLNESNAIVSAQDYDCWGYLYSERQYSSNNRYKFTEKERDNETGGYDYFGARYYDSRLGRWLSVEIKQDSYPGYSPYSYSFDNPIHYIDPNGKDPRRDQMANLNQIVSILESNTLIETAIAQFRGTESPRYVYTEKGGFIDMVHFLSAAYVTTRTDLTLPSDQAYELGKLAGELIEENQNIESSAWDPEDLPSNEQGARFGLELNVLESYTITKSFIEKFEKFMQTQGILDKDDPSIARDKVSIRENEKDEPLPPGKPYDYTPYRGEPVK
jgi:RHS repeat-associated protein